MLCGLHRNCPPDVHRGHPANNGGIVAFNTDNLAGRSPQVAVHCLAQGVDLVGGVVCIRKIIADADGNVMNRVQVEGGMPRQHDDHCSASKTSQLQVGV